MNKLMYSTKPLVAALEEFDRTAPERAALWDKIETNEDVVVAEKADQDALIKVQQAFWEVTKDRNSRENCACVDISFARKIAALDN